jgi:hypothetical protein
MVEAVGLCVNWSRQERAPSSPVTATRRRTGGPVAADSMASAIATPALGASFGVGAIELSDSKLYYVKEA